VGDSPESEGLAQDPASQSDLYRKAPVGLCHFDLDLRYVHVNEWLASLNGLAVSEHLASGTEAYSTFAPGC